MEMEQKSFLPDFCGVRAVLAVVVSSVVLAMVIALASVDRLEQLWSGFSMAALYVLWIALASAGVFCLARRWLAGMSHARVGFLAWLLVLLVCAAVAEAVAWLMPVELVAGISHLDLLVRTLGIGAILAALILRYRYEYHLQRQQELAEGPGALPRPAGAHPAPLSLQQPEYRHQPGAQSAGEGAADTARPLRPVPRQPRQ